MMLYLVYAILIYMLFDNYKVFSSAQKSFKGVDPLLIKSVLVIVGVYSIDLTVKKFVIEPMSLQEGANTLINPLKEFFGTVRGIFR